MARNRDSESIKKVIQQLINTSNLKRGFQKITAKEAWEEVMGPGVMSYTGKIELRNDLLIVELNSAALREESSYGKEKIVQMLNEHMGDNLIKQVRLK